MLNNSYGSVLGYCLTFFYRTRSMASHLEVKKYLAHWFQLGKGVLSDKHSSVYLPEKIIQGDRYSDDFEQCWEAMMQEDPGQLYLRGTDQSVADLLSPAWEIVSCARCEMPIPLPLTKQDPPPCTCDDLPNWPNEELPRPRMPVNSHDHLAKMRSRLQKHSVE